MQEETRPVWLPQVEKWGKTWVGDLYSSPRVAEKLSNKKMAGKSIPWRRKTMCTGPKRAKKHKTQKAFTKSKEERGGQCGCRKGAVGKKQGSNLVEGVVNNIEHLGVKGGGREAERRQNTRGCRGMAGFRRGREVELAAGLHAGHEMKSKNLVLGQQYSRLPPSY